MEKKRIRALLVGAPNCGKSLLFNRLTGRAAPVGNRAGVTVGQTAAVVSGKRFGEGCPDFELVDLPGIRSLDPASADEEVTCAALERGDADFIINIMSATTLERCLVLSAGIRAAYPAIPMVCVVNMYDELKRDGGELSVGVIERFLGVRCVAVSAAKGIGLSELRSEIRALALTAAIAPRTAATEPHRMEKAAPCRCSRATASSCSSATARRCFASAKQSGFSSHCAAGGGPAASHTRTSVSPAQTAAAALARKPRPHRATDIADRFLTHPAIGIPLIFTVMALIFAVTFGAPGNYITTLFESLILTPTGTLIRLITENPACPALLSSFLGGCLLGGVGAVVSFLPRITLLFILLSLLEDSGYMARASFVMDMPLRAAGISGRAFVPVLLGFGCSVSAIMSARTVGDSRERCRCALFLPLVSCSARAPVYSLIAAAFFPNLGWLAVFSIYVLGVAVFLLFCAVSRAATRSFVPMFITELPRYRLPRLRVTIPSAAARAGEFLVRAGGIIFFSTAAVWLLSSLSPRFTVVSSPDESLLALISGAAAPIFAPLGFGSWQAVSALLCGIGAKEGVISALGVLVGGNPGEALAAAGIFTPASALSFMVFVSMYTPCAASIPVMISESGSAKKTAAGIAAMLAVAYLLSYLTYISAIFFMGGAT